MSEPTPGPWRIERDGDVVDEYKLIDWPYLITAADGTKVCNLVECETSEEDARLIASAPEMYDAIRQWLFAWDNDDEVEKGNGLRSMRVVVAKVKGEVQ